LIEKENIKKWKKELLEFNMILLSIIKFQRVTFIIIQLIADIICLIHVLLSLNDDNIYEIKKNHGHQR